VGAGGRALLATLCVAAAGCGGHEPATPPGVPASIALSSPALGATVPRRFTCDGAGTSPPLRWSGAPAKAAELVLVVQDPDAPGGTFVHWTGFGIPAAPSGTIPAGAHLRSGRNSTGHSGWTPPCPPRGDAPHRYEFSLYALAEPSGLAVGAEPVDVRDALTGALARGTLTARYGR
jgi:Raf kinase inhibitor-like YbhB/YbcL family protein